MDKAAIASPYKNLRTNRYRNDLAAGLYADAGNYSSNAFLKIDLNSGMLSGF